MKRRAEWGKRKINDGVGSWWQKGEFITIHYKWKEGALWRMSSRGPLTLCYMRPNQIIIKELKLAPVSVQEYCKRNPKSWAWIGYAVNSDS